MPTFPRSSWCLLFATMALLAPDAMGQHYYLANRLPSPSPALDDSFGVGLAVDDRYIAVGSYRENVSIGHDGRVYMYNSNTGAYVQTIVGPNPFQNGSFGCSVALDGDLLLVGSYSDQNANGSAGAGYLFNANSGALLADFTAEVGSPGDQTGLSVALEQPLALLGSPSNDDKGSSTGAVHAFHTSLLFQITTLYADVPIPGERFGTSVAIDGDYLVVGAPGNGGGGAQTGAVYVFDVVTGVQLHRIVPPGSALGDIVGTSVDVRNGVIAIGAPLHGAPGAGGSGIVYTYDAASGSLIDSYSPPNPSPLQQFGTSVALDEGRLVVGSTYSYGGTDQVGSVFVFEDGEAELVNVYLIPEGQGFGRHVAAYEGRTAASGPGLGDIDGYAASIGRYCSADINADGSRDFFDVSAFLKYSVDYNMDGSFDFFDVSAFLADFNSECL